MGFKASFLLVVCLLIFGNVLAKLGKKEEPKEEKAKEPEPNNGRRKQDDVKLFTCDDQCLSRLHNNSRNNLADELIVPRAALPGIDAFFIKHIPLVEPQRLMDNDADWAEMAAIWIVKGEMSGFSYAPPHPDSDTNTAWVDNEYTAAPPRNGVNENYLLARPEWWPSKKAAKKLKSKPLHAEWILHNQVTTYNDLKAYVAAQTPITSVMMYSVKHPCRDCAGLLVDILNQIKQANGQDLALPCHLGWRAMWDENDDVVNTEVLQPGGITRVAKFGGIGQPLRPDTKR